MEEFEVKDGTWNGTWKSKNGKLVKYTRESYQLNNSQDDYGEYYLQITKWPKTTSVEIVMIVKEEGHDTESQWSNSKFHRYIKRCVKLPHAEFEAKRDELIRNALQLANQEFGYITFQ